MADAEKALREAQAGKPLAKALRALPVLRPAEREQVVATFTTLIEGLYAHLPLKQAMYGVDPVQRLRLLRQRVDLVDDASFHGELADIVTGLRDAHTRYIGPTSVAGETARLPFLVEAYGPAEAPRYIVSKVATDRSGIDDERFVPGVELVWWNAVPIDRAVDLHADHETGGRPDSRRARALESLTLRSLQFGPPPDEHWVDVGYLDADTGDEREVRIGWRVVRPKRARTAGPATSERATTSERARDVERPRALAMALDPAAEAHRRTKKLLFAPEPWRDDHQGAAPRTPPATADVPATPATPAAVPAVPDDEWIDTPFQDAVSAKKVVTGSGRFGYLRLWSFDLADDRAYVAEVVRLLGLLDDGSTLGLIVDLRGNPGGLIWAAERLLQLFTPRPVVPTRFSFRATGLTRTMADAGQSARLLDPWHTSLDEAVATGEPYSRTVPLTPVERCNDIGQLYGGPVVAIVDPNTYSAGDLFAAGFVDNELGILLSVGQATGGGGANVWLPADVEDAVAGTDIVLPVLPAGIAYTVSVRRATRSGAADGAAIEDVGIAGHQTYPMTHDDLVHDNRDLLDFCGTLLKDQPRSRLHVVPADDGRRVELSAEGLDRVELRADGRFVADRALDDGASPITVDLPQDWAELEILASAGRELRQRRLLQR